MRVVPLKSRFGCRRCKERRRKCDEVKPVCGDCSRLGFLCLWITPPPVSRAKQSQTNGGIKTLSGVDDEASDNVSATKSLVLANKVSGFRSYRLPTNAFDSPSILRTHAVPDNGTKECKPLLQYLSERGTSILRYPPDAQGRNLNPFRVGFQMASQSPVQIGAYLCIGAGHLSHINPMYKKFALKYYTSVMHELRECLTRDPEVPPTERICAVAALLSYYELIAFHSPKNRLAHLVGFHRLVEARLSHQLEWSPMKVLLEQYLHSMVLGSLFHTELLVGQKSITYADNIVSIIKDGQENLSREIVGVPEELTIVVYKLAILNTSDVRQHSRRSELDAIESKLIGWKPAAHLLLPLAGGRLLIAQLYHLACSCLVQTISDRRTGGTSDRTKAFLKQAHDILEHSPTRFRLINSMVWPLTILSVFAVEESQRAAFKEPISILVRDGMIKGYQSILTFLSMVEDEQLGPDVFGKPDLLSMVHM